MTLFLLLFPLLLILLSLMLCYVMMCLLCCVLFVVVCLGWRHSIALGLYVWPSRTRLSPPRQRGQPTWERRCTPPPFSLLPLPLLFSCLVFIIVIYIYIYDHDDLLLPPLPPLPPFSPHPLYPNSNPPFHANIYLFECDFQPFCYHWDGHFGVYLVPEVDICHDMDPIYPPPPYDMYCNVYDHDDPLPPLPPPPLLLLLLLLLFISLSIISSSLSLLNYCIFHRDDLALLSSYVIRMETLLCTGLAIGVNSTWPLSSSTEGPMSTRRTRSIYPLSLDPLV